MFLCYGILIQSEEHGDQVLTHGIVAHQGMVLDVFHGSSSVPDGLAVQIVEPAFAVGHGFVIAAEEGAESAIFQPPDLELRVFVTGDDHGLPLGGLEQGVAAIVPAGELRLIRIGEFGLAAVKNLHEK